MSYFFDVWILKKTNNVTCDSCDVVFGLDSNKAYGLFQVTIFQQNLVAIFEAYIASIDLRPQYVGAAKLALFFVTVA